VTHTIIKSGLDMGNILLVLMIFMLVMSVMGVILFDIRDFSIGQMKFFLNALDVWYVLFICVTQDGWNEILDQFRDPVSSHFLIIVGRLKVIPLHS
jgi:cation channel sperm-associated protein 4